MRHWCLVWNKARCMLLPSHRKKKISNNSWIRNKKPVHCIMRSYKKEVRLWLLFKHNCQPLKHKWNLFLEAAVLPICWADCPRWKQHWKLALMKRKHSMQNFKSWRMIWFKEKNLCRTWLHCWLKPNWRLRIWNSHQLPPEILHRKISKSEWMNWK